MKKELRLRWTAPIAPVEQRPMIHRAKRGADLALDLGTRTWAQVANSFDFFDGIGVSRRKPALPPFARLPRMLRGVDALLVVGKAFEIKFSNAKSPLAQQPDRMASVRPALGPLF